MRAGSREGLKEKDDLSARRRTNTNNNKKGNTQRQQAQQPQQQPRGWCARTLKVLAHEKVRGREELRAEKAQERSAGLEGGGG